MGVSITRYRCTACGNLTRFDVTTERRTRAFHHYTLGGALDIEDTEVLSERVESVECRWCGPAAEVAVVDAASLEALEPTQPSGSTGDAGGAPR